MHNTGTAGEYFNGSDGSTPDASAGSLALLFDTGVFSRFTSALNFARIPVETIVRNKNFPTVVITRTVGQELLGEHGLKTDGDKHSYIRASNPAQHTIVLKPWNERKALYRVPVKPAEEERYLHELANRYELLVALSHAKKLRVIETDICKSHSGNGYSGHMKHEGEKSLGAYLMQDDPLAKGKVAVITCDTHSSDHIFPDFAKLQKQQEHSPRALLSLRQFFVALARAGILSNDQYNAVESRYLRTHPDAKTNLHKSDHGGAHSPKLSAAILRATNTNADITLGDWMAEPHSTPEAISSAYRQIAEEKQRQLAEERRQQQLRQGIESLVTKWNGLRASGGSSADTASAAAFPGRR